MVVWALQENNNKSYEGVMDDLKQILDLASRMAVVLIGSGAEISRVEETLQHISDHFEVDRTEMFVIANGLFVNMQKDGVYEHVRIQYVPDVSANMTNICRVNEMSRALCESRCTIDEALDELSDIEHYRCRRRYLVVLASGFGAGAFCYLFGGNFRDCIGAGISGFILWLILELVDKFHLSRVLLNIAGAWIATFGCLVFYKIELIQHLNNAIMGAVIPLVPGVLFLNGIRDIADGDFISGGIRLLEAIMIFICIAAGIVIATRLWQIYL